MDAAKNSFTFKTSNWPKVELSYTLYAKRTNSEGVDVVKDISSGTSKKNLDIAFTFESISASAEYTVYLETYVKSAADAGDDSTLYVDSVRKVSLTA